MIARADPVAKLAVALAVPLFLVLSVDPVTAGTALALEALALPFCGVGPRKLLRHGWIVLAGAIPAGVLTVLIGQDRGDVLIGWGVLTVSQGSAVDGLAITLRVLAIGLPGVVLIATTDPTDLADSLAQNLRLPHRFVLSALAAFRLLGVLADEWRSLGMARRARGLPDGFGVAGVRVRGGQVFALLVLAIRRGTVLATTMEARGFGVLQERTWARPAHFGASDAVVAAGGLVIGGVATAVAVATGWWNPLLA
jgi:energy-coupling factor transport system permease protein